MKTLDEIIKFCNDKAVSTQAENFNLSRQFIVLKEMATSLKWQNLTVSSLVDSLEPDYKPESNRATAERALIDFIG